MADLFVLGFPTKEKAEAVMEVSRDLQKQELLDLEAEGLNARSDHHDAVKELTR